MRFFTFRRDALARLRAGQKLRFLKGRGYWLFGRPVGQITMYDSVNTKEIPPDAQAVAGYVGGYWPTFPTLQLEWPHAHRLSIAVNDRQDAECLDVEQGDAAPDQAPAWVKRQIGRGVWRPVVYASVSQMPSVLRALARDGVSRSEIRVWTAHYTDKQHLCSKRCGFGTLNADATQYTNHALGRNLDASVCAASFFKS